MEQIAIVDGVVYVPYTLKNEQELEDAVIEHAEEIFGEKSFYLPKKKLKTPAGIGSIPDGFVVDFKNRRWYVVEVELATHDIYSHIVNQITRFFGAVRNDSQRYNLGNAFFEWFKQKPVSQAKAKAIIDGRELFKTITDIISVQPKVIVIIDKKTKEAAEALMAIPAPAGESQLIEFRTYIRHDVGDMRVHLHLIDTIRDYEPVIGTAKPKFVNEKEPPQTKVISPTDDIKMLQDEIIKWYKGAFPDAALNFPKDYTGLAVKFPDRTRQYALASMHPKKKWLRFHIKLLYDTIPSPPSFARKVDWFDWWKDGDTMARVSSREELPELYRLLELAHRQIMKWYAKEHKGRAQQGKRAEDSTILPLEEYYIPQTKVINSTNDIKMLQDEIIDWYKGAFPDAALNFPKDYTGLAVKFHDWTTQYNLAEMHPTKKWLRFHIKLLYDTIPSPPSFAEKVNWLSWWKDGDTMARVSSREELPELFRLIELAHKQLIESYGKQQRKSAGETQGNTGALPQKEYHIPLLETIVELGGRAKKKQILDAMFEKIRDKLMTNDFAETSTGAVRWKNRIAWAWLNLKEQGYCSSNSPRGIWEITNKGRKYLEKHLNRD